MKVLFMGTPDFAVPTLRELCCSDHEVVGVITQPDKPCGRGYKLKAPPVKEYAIENGIPVYQPTTLRGDEFAALLASIDPEVIVVVAYGKILPVNVLEYPKFGCINVHGSLLPEYRGAAPMQRAIIDGKHRTGVTTMLMAEGLDTGDMLMKESLEIDEDDNFEDVHAILSEMGACLLLKTLKELAVGTLKPKAQNEAHATYAAKIEKSECFLDFSLDARTVHNKIRGLSPRPLAFTHTPDGRLLKIIKSRVADDKTVYGEPGEVMSLEGDINVACGRGMIAISAVLPEGKERMTASDFIRGRRLRRGDILS